MQEFYPAYLKFKLRKKMKKVFTAGLALLLLLGVIFTSPALSMDTETGGYNYKWSGTYSHFSGHFGNVLVTPFFHSFKSINLIPQNPFESSYPKNYVQNRFSNSPGILNNSGLSSLGLNINMDFSSASLWFTGMYGKTNLCVNNTDNNYFPAYLVAAGANTEIGIAKIHGQFVYAIGDDSIHYNNDVSSLGSSSRELWVGKPYFFAEIMGHGEFDNIVPSDKLSFNQVSDIAALNFGASIKPMDKLTLKGNIWYAKLADKNFPGKSTLGSEIDLVITYELIEDLKFDFVGAYLFSGDRSNLNSASEKQFKNNKNAYPYELGARLSLSF